MDARESPTPPVGIARPKTSRDVLARTSSSSMTQPQLGAQPSAAMASSSRAARANTPTASRSASKLVDDKPRPASRDSLKQKMLKKPDDALRPSKSEEVGDTRRRGEQPANAAQQLKALKTDFDSLRNHLTCKICDRMLYQPYTIACGHTYCYTVRARASLAPATC